MRWLHELLEDPQTEMAGAELGYKVNTDSIIGIGMATREGHLAGRSRQSSGIDCALNR